MQMKKDILWLPCRTVTISILILDNDRSFVETPTTVAPRSYIELHRGGIDTVVGRNMAPGPAKSAGVRGLGLVTSANTRRGGRKDRIEAASHSPRGGG
jgi:hypothetical protein